jgi:RHS repeat-associated protein
MLPDGRHIDYVLDARSRRIGRKVDGALAQGFLYNSALTIAAELDGAGNVVSRFVYATQAHVPDYLVRGGKSYRILTDHLGSPRLVVDTATGTVAQRMDYDAFGNVLQDTNPGFQPFGFAGGLYDRDTKLVHFGVREYDPETGRWTSKDPLDFRGGDPNLYGYVQGDPVNAFDPSGLAPNFPFTDEKDAARQALRDINPQSIKENREYAGTICKRGSKYYYSPPTKLGPGGGSFHLICPVGGTPSGWYHTHGRTDPKYDSEHFSDTDFVSSRGGNLHGYVATPKGQFRGIERSPDIVQGVPTWGTNNYGRL